jgi:predicted negative regulator of RcsB-dependent stress response
MVVFMMLFKLKEKSFAQQFSEQNFYIRAVSFILIRIYVFGYFNWNSKNKRENNQ